MVSPVTALFAGCVTMAAMLLLYPNPVKKIVQDWFVWQRAKVESANRGYEWCRNNELAAEPGAAVNVVQLKSGLYCQELKPMAGGIVKLCKKNKQVAEVIQSTGLWAPSF